MARCVQGYFGLYRRTLNLISIVKYIIPKVLLFGNTNYYYAMLADESTETANRRRYYRREGKNKGQLKQAENESRNNEITRVVHNKRSGIPSLLYIQDRHIARACFQMQC